MVGDNECAGRRRGPQPSAAARAAVWSAAPHPGGIARWFTCSVAVARELLAWCGAERWAVDDPERSAVLGRAARNIRFAPLLVGRLGCEAFDEGQRVGYRFKARGSYASLLPAGLITTPEMVTPAGFEPAISTLKGSRPGPG